MADKSPDHVGCSSMYRKLFRKREKIIVTSCNGRLPLELESNIFSRLPVKLLFRLQCVCKRWRDEINNPYFKRSHTRHQIQIYKSNGTTFILRCWRQSLDIFSVHIDSPIQVNKLSGNGLPESFNDEIVGSCNGLLCFRKIDHLPKYKTMTRFSLYNPATGIFNNRIPDLIPSYANFSCEHKLGFGYDCINDDYKIFCLVRNMNRGVDKTRQVNAWVYSLKNNLWKSTKTPPPIHREYEEVSLKSYLTNVVYNNAMHWIGQNANTRKKIILSFDLGTEEYNEVQPPNNNDDDEFSKWKLFELRGCLHLVQYDATSTKDVYNIRIWVMKKSSWVKLIHCLSVCQFVESQLIEKHALGNRIITSRIYYILPFPCAYSENGKEIVLYSGGKAFIRCDLSSGEITRVKLCGLPENWKDTGYEYELIPWFASLVSPLFSNTSI